MSVRIGHASIDERGNGRNGVAGDQSGKEVCTRNYYDHKNGWSCVLRPKSATLAEKSAKACEAGCANNNIGYDMNQRNTMHAQAVKVGHDLSKIKTKCETDCSAFMTECAIAGGAKIEYGSNAPTTSTMRNVFKNSGCYDVLTSSKYLKGGEYLRRGDILVCEGHHTVMALSNGNKTTTTVEIATPTIEKGSKGNNVKILQKNLNAAINAELEVDGIAGKLTVAAIKDFQKKEFPNDKSEWDGVYGNKTYEKMKTVIK